MLKTLRLFRLILSETFNHPTELSIISEGFNGSFTVRREKIAKSDWRSSLSTAFLVAKESLLHPTGVSTLSRKDDGTVTVKWEKPKKR